MPGLVFKSSHKLVWLVQELMSHQNKEMPKLKKSQKKSNKMKQVVIFFFFSVKSHPEAPECDFKPFVKSRGTENY